MDKDFDFEKDLDFDADDFLSGAGFDDIDLSDHDPADADPADLDFSDLDALFAEKATGADIPEEDAEPDFDFDFDKEDPAPGFDFDAEDEPEFDPEEAEPDFDLSGETLPLEDEEPDFFSHAGDTRKFTLPEDMLEQEAQDEEPELLFDRSRNAPQVPEEENEPQEEQEEPQEEKPAKRRREPRVKEPKEPKVPKVHIPNPFTKLFDLYFGPVVNKEQFQEIVSEPGKSRRRKKSKQQIFKEVYLPPIIACVALVMVLAFVIGAISNSIDEKQLKADQEKQQLQESIAQAEQEQAEYLSVMEQAAELALSYNYDDAITLLESFSGYANYPEMATRRAEYVTARDSMVEYKDASKLVNLSFHPLIVDTARAFSDENYGGKYNQNFVTTGEFQKILEQLYANDYVLVDFNSFVGVTQTISGEDQFQMMSITLPSGKKPVMLTETLMGYYQYMVDPDKDGTPDAKGGGFANKLVVDDYGNIKAAYVDASGNSLVGDYDLVPILEAFIAEHPDFSYKGARAILATTGDEGIFGYRCNTAYVQNVSQEFYNSEKAGAIEIVNALKSKGYTLACFTYANQSYRQLNTTQINADLSNWTSQITSIIGDIDVFVYAQGADLSDYTGAAYKAMYQTGFRYFISSGKEASTTINNTYVHQKRLMVTGENMAWYSDRFKDLFDCNLVLDSAARGNVPKSA